MKLSFDQTTDYSFRELHRFLKKAEYVPEYITKFSDDIDYKSLSDCAFADKYNRAFPKNTKEATYLSTIHFINKKAELAKKYNDTYINEVEGRLSKSAQLFEITEDIESYKKAFNVKEATDYSVKTIYEAELDGTKLPLFTYKTAAELKLAADQFASQYNKIPFEWRKDIAESFVKHAKEENLAELPDIICKYAGMFYSDPIYLKDELSRRASHCKTAEHKANYQTLIDNIDELDSIEDFMKIAETCYFMERAEGLHDNYKTASVCGDPVDRIFNLSIDKVAENLDVVKVDQGYFKIAELQAVNPEIFKQAFGVDVDVQDTDSLREVFPASSKEDVSLFCELSGVRPI